MRLTSVTCPGPRVQHATTPPHSTLDANWCPDDPGFVIIAGADKKPIFGPQGHEGCGVLHGVGGGVGGFGICVRERAIERESQNAVVVVVV